MKSNRLLIATLATVALSLGACSDSIETPVESGDGFVTFTAQLPEGVNSRAYSEGELAQTLKYAVYESGTNTIIYSSDDTNAPVAQYGNKNFTLSLPLVKGQTYDLIFWAETKASADFTSPYTFSPADQTITISYDGNDGNDGIKCNEEARDAFFSAEKGLLVTGAMQKNIELYRPFAQLNIGTNDIEAAKKAKIELGTTSVTVKDVYNTLNLLTGEATGDEEVVFDYAELPEGEDFPVTGYDYLSMNYILTGDQIIGEDVNQAQKETKDIRIAIKDNAGNDVNSFDLSAVPFQRNYRTNIYGALLTSTVDYTIEIVPDYNKPDNNKEVTEYSALIDAIENGESEIVIPAKTKIKIPANSEPIELKDGTSLTIDGYIGGPTAKGIFTVPEGNEVTIDGTGTIEFDYTGDRTDTDGNSHAIRAIDVKGKASIKNIDFVCPSNKAGDAIFCDENSDVTIENVTVNTGFRAITTKANSKITIKGGEYNSTSNNQVKDNDNESVYAYCIVVGGVGTVCTIEGVTVTGIQGAVSVEKGAQLTINDCDISTHDLEGKPGTAFYAVYAAQSGETVINSGKFYSPRWAVYLGNNDQQGDTFGKATIKGGIFSSVMFDQEQNKAITLLDGYEWIDNNDLATSELYPYVVVAKE